MNGAQSPGHQRPLRGLPSILEQALSRRGQLWNSWWGLPLSRRLGSDLQRKCQVPSALRLTTPAKRYGQLETKALGGAQQKPGPSVLSECGPMGWRGPELDPPSFHS